MASSLRVWAGLTFPTKLPTNGKAVCGKTAHTVWREGEPNSIGSPYPYRLGGRQLQNWGAECDEVDSLTSTFLIPCFSLEILNPLGPGEIP